jgi:hypothetical protein
MKHLRRYIRQILLAEAAKQPEDLTDGHKVIMYDSGQTITFSLVWQSTKGIQAENTQIETGQITITQDPARNGPCSNAWAVVSSAARHGFGPILYDLAMEHAGNDGLMADRRSVSDKAYNVWKFYLNSRSDVKPKQLDIHIPDRFRGAITPDDKSDDCVQDKYFNNYFFQRAASNFKAGNARAPRELNKEDYLDSPMTKAFVKFGSPTTDKLRAMGKLTVKDNW